MFNLKEALERGYATKVTQWPTYDGGQLDRSRFITSSEILKCARQLKFEKQHATMYGSLPFPNWGYAERGNIIEAWVVDMLERAGRQLEYAGANQRSFYVGVQSGTPDGLERYKDGYWLHEFKSIDPRTNRRNLPKKEHVAQLQQNMDLVATCLDTGVYGGSLSYIDASNLQMVNQYDIEVDHEYAASLQERAEVIVAAPSPEALPTEGMHNGGCDRCSFTAECSRIVAGELGSLQNAGKGVFRK